MAIASALPPLPQADCLARLRQFSQVNLQFDWAMHLGELPQEQALQASGWEQWPIAELNDRSHIAWEAGKQVLWLGQCFTVPEQLQGYAIAGHQIRLDLTWWADSAEIFINGRLVQEGDLFDCVTKFKLSERAQPGEKFAIAIRLTSPGHDRGALVLSQLRFEASNSSPEICPEPGFVADELTVLGRYLQRFAPEKLEVFETALAPLAELINRPIGHRQDLMTSQDLTHQLSQVRQALAPFSDWLKQRRIDLLGHAHLDMAWLWPIAETWQAAENTFESALKLQGEFPALTFGHSSPALYAWIQEHRPELFERIKTTIAQGRWEVIAGPWIEPDCILPSGESLVRQLLYGQRYVQQELGVNNRVAWLPDSFGFCHQLPQILKQAGVDYFITEKLLWNDSTEFPHQLFKWRSPDGTSITSYMSARIGTQIDAVQMAEYGCGWEAATGIEASLWLPGVGDHGGGPTREMLETAERWQRSPFFPQLEFGKLHDYLDGLLEGSLGDSAAQTNLPIWERDLYLEYHRGCYTSHADQKRYNRHSEALLYEAELWSSLASLATDAPYPKIQIETLWKKVLFNQFHDILPGSSIPEVFDDADRDWEIVLEQGAELRLAAMAAIAQAIALPPKPHPEAQPLLLFNSLNWSRAEVVALDLPQNDNPAQAWFVCDGAGKPLPSQRSSETQLLVQSPPVPGVGYGLIWICPAPLASSSAPEPASSPTLNPEKSPQQYQFENDWLRVTIDPQTGDLAQVFSKSLGHDLLSGPGNQLQAFQDQGQYWDAWNIDPQYQDHPLPNSELINIDWISQGPLEWRLRVERRISHSRCRHDYVLKASSPLLYIETEIDWQEDYVLLKTAFPLALEAEELITEVPHGVISRKTKPKTEAEKAQWEVPALRWAALSCPTTTSTPWGVMLLNDCKYGYDAQPSCIRLTLLRASNWPDPGCDRGLQTMTYALHGHQGNWAEGDSVKQGYNLQHPLRLHWLEPPAIQVPATSTQPLKASSELISLGQSGLILTALKQSEDDAQRWILHGYESLGAPAQVEFRSDLALVWGDRTDGLERPLEKPGQDSAQSPSLQVRPFEIMTVELEHSS